MTDTWTHAARADSSIGPVQKAIFARRSQRRFTSEQVDRAVIARLLDAAAQAPNHRLTRPWRFFVLDRPGVMREQITQLAEEVAFRGMPEPRDVAARARARAKAEGIASVPVLVIAYSVPGRNPEETRENYAAVACSLQNLQLAAVEESLVSGWSTDALTHDPGLKSLVGAENDWEIVGALYLGYAAPTPMVAKQRPGAAAFTRWLSE